MMLLDRYDEQGLLVNTNFKAPTSRANEAAYRGELVLIEGDIADQSGRRKPPKLVVTGAIILADESGITLISGFLDALADLQGFVERFKDDFAEGMRALFLVPNIKEPVQVELAGVTFMLIPCTDGMAWNELVDLLALEKTDFKGQSAADKVVTVYKAFDDYTPKYGKTTYEDALANATDTKRETRGPV